MVRATRRGVRQAELGELREQEESETHRKTSEWAHPHQTCERPHVPVAGTVSVRRTSKKGPSIRTSHTPIGNTLTPLRYGLESAGAAMGSGVLRRPRAGLDLLGAPGVEMENSSPKVGGSHS